MRSLCFIFLFGLLVGCAGHDGNNISRSPQPLKIEVTISPDDRKILQDFSAFHEIRTVAKLPPSVIALCAGSRHNFADPGQPWNDSDYVYPDRPIERLIWAATDGQYYVVHSEHGGFVQTCGILIVIINSVLNNG